MPYFSLLCFAYEYACQDRCCLLPRKVCVLVKIGVVWYLSILTYFLISVKSCLTISLCLIRLVMSGASQYLCTLALWGSLQRSTQPNQASLLLHSMELPACIQLLHSFWLYCLRSHVLVTLLPQALCYHFAPHILCSVSLVLHWQKLLKKVSVSLYYRKRIEMQISNYTQGRIIGQCLSTAKCGQFYGRPNYQA